MAETARQQRDRLRRPAIVAQRRQVEAGQGDADLIAVAVAESAAAAADQVETGGRVHVIKDADKDADIAATVADEDTALQ